MLDAFIIEQLKREREQENLERPRVHVPDIREYQREPEPEEKPERGVVIIDPDGEEHVARYMGKSLRSVRSISVYERAGPEFLFPGHRDGCPRSAWENYRL